MKKATRIQYRAICSVCFKQHAVNGAALVDHGYQIPHAWHQRVGSCDGVGASHFGTPEGREIAKGTKIAYEKFLRDEQALLARVIRGDIKRIKGKNTHAYKAEEVWLTEVDGSWFTDAIKRLQYHTESNIHGVTGDIATITKLIAEWKPVAPVAVEVETGPTIHMHWDRSPSKVLCVYRSHSMRGNYTHRHSSKVEGDVTCSACLKTLAGMKAAKIVEEKAAALVAAMVAKHGPWTSGYSDAARAAVSEIRYKMPNEDKAVKKAACYIIER